MMFLQKSSQSGDGHPDREGSGSAIVHSDPQEVHCDADAV
jgi:hypothetical protein